MHLQPFVERLIKLTRRIRRVYVNLIARTEFSAELYTCWNGMAEEACQTVRLLEQSAQFLHFMECAPDALEAALTNIETQLAIAEAAAQQTDLSADEALRHTLSLENSELKAVVKAWCQGFQPSLEVLLQDRIPEEERQLRRLVDTVQTCSTDAALHDRATAMWSVYQHQQHQKTSCVD
jgi:hypothetical protein